MTVLVIGNAKLILGDAYVIAPQLGPVDSIVTDPPYLIDTKGGGIFRKKRRVMDDIAAAGIDKGFDISIINPQLYKSAVVFCHNSQIPILSTYLFEQYDRCVLCAWRKTNPMPVANKNYQPETELYFHGGLDTEIEPYFHAWDMAAYPLGELADKKRIVDAQVGKSIYDHPTVKPDKVMDKIMRNVNGATVLDPFAGTGSTGVAALKAGKHFIGIEQNPVFFNIMVSRIAGFYATAS